MSAEVRRFVALGFASVHEALGAEAALVAAGLRATAIPSPRELGDICGIAMRVELEDASEAERVLALEGTPPRARAEVLDF